MDKSEFLNYKALRLEASQIRAVLCQLSAERYAVSKLELSDSPRRSRSRGASFEGKVIRYEEAVAMYERKLAAIDAQTIVMEHAISSLEDPVERLVMRLRYIEGQRWVNVCVALQDLGFGERQVYRLHGSALEKLKGYQKEEL